jgi:hypothetical protein
MSAEGEEGEEGEREGEGEGGGGEREEEDEPHMLLLHESVEISIDPEAERKHSVNENDTDRRRKSGESEADGEEEQGELRGLRWLMEKRRNRRRTKALRRPLRIRFYETFIMPLHITWGRIEPHSERVAREVDDDEHDAGIPTLKVSHQELWFDLIFVALVSLSVALCVCASHSCAHGFPCAKERDE